MNHRIQFHITDFAAVVDLEVKGKEIPGFCKRTENAGKHEVDGDPCCSL